MTDAISELPEPRQSKVVRRASRLSEQAMDKAVKKYAKALRRLADK